MKADTVRLTQVSDYRSDLSDLDFGNELFEVIKSTDFVVIKPNWVSESHFTRKGEWESVISHPAVVTAVIKRVISKLGINGRIVITDGPEAGSSFSKILDHYPVNEWIELTQKKGIKLEIIDLREYEYSIINGIVSERRKLKGDPSGSTEINLLNDLSEFSGHVKNGRTYYGSDYDISETNAAHDGINNKYRVSKTVLSCDVFINIPKLKTHRKAGITGCLKNLVGINTYKNFLPHHTEGSPENGGDQFNSGSLVHKIEGRLLILIKKYFLRNAKGSKYFGKAFKVGEKVFGRTEEVVRSGNWFGNDTLWRTILDLNKILFYSNQYGNMGIDDFKSSRKYIGIVDAIIAGEGNGPLSPDPVNMGYLICGSNPVAIDTVCATLMGFDPMKIPSIKNAYSIRSYKLVNFNYSDVRVLIKNENLSIRSIPEKLLFKFKPHFGWQKHIELKLD